MSGPVITGLESEDEKPRPEGVDYQANPSERFAQNDPRLDQEPNPLEPAVMAGLTAAQIGLTGVSLNRLQDPRAPENRPGAPTGQQLKDNNDADNDIYSGSNADAQRRITNWIQSGAAVGMIAGRIGEKEGDGVVLSEDRDAYYYASLNASWEDMLMNAETAYQESESLAAEADEVQEDVDVALDGLAEEMDMINESIIAQKQEIEALKQRMATAPESERAALAQQIAQKEQSLSQSQAVYTAYENANIKLTADMQAAQDAIKESSDNIKSLKEQLQAATTDEDRARINAQITAERDKLKDAKNDLEALKQDVQLTRELTAMGRDRVIDTAELTRIHEMSQNNPNFALIAKDLITAATTSGAMDGITVKGLKGESLSGAAASTYLLAQLGITDIDAARAKTEQALAANPGDAALQQNLAALNASRYALEEQAQACIADTAQPNLPEGRAVDTAKISLAALTVSSVVLGSSPVDAVVYKDNKGDLQIQHTVDGEVRSEAVKDQPNAAELMAEISAQVAAGKSLTLTPEITAAQLALATATLELARAEISRPDSYAEYRAEQKQREASGTTDTAQTDEEKDKAVTTSSTTTTTWSGDEQLARNIPNPFEEEQRNLERVAEQIAAFAKGNPGGTMSAESVEEMKRLVGYAAVEKMMAEEGVKAPTGILADMGIDFGFGLRTASTMAGVYLFSDMAYHMGQHIPTFDTRENIGVHGIGGGYSSFADSPEFAATNDPRAVDPSYASGLQSSVVLAGLFGLGPTAAPSPAEQERLDQQRRLEQERFMAWQEEQRLLAMQRQGAEMGASMGSGPKPPSSGSIA